MMRATTAVRGISNVSHVSCHLACALQLIIHGFEPLRDALIQISLTNLVDGDDDLLVALGSFCTKYQGDDAPTDPSHLYQIVRERTSIDPDNLGDAVTGLRRILQLLRTSVLLKNISQAVLSGTMRQDIIGIQGQRKRTKTRQIDSPCPLILGSAPSVEHALAQAMTTPIRGYDWEQATNYVETTPQENDAAGEDEWITYKALSFVTLPHFLLLHLSRFAREDSMTPLHSTMDVPLSLQLSTDAADTSSEYDLQSAILLVMDVSNDDENEGGHYVSVIKGGDGDWYLVDDDMVKILDSDQVHMFLSGERGTNSRHYIAVLLFYQRQDDMDVTPLLEQLRDDLALREIHYDESLVGRRVRVRWSKGKFYAGVVSSYDAATLKHTVTYDDGDMKQYNLKKKKIEWD